MLRRRREKGVARARGISAARVSACYLGWSLVCASALSMVAPADAGATSFVGTSSITSAALRSAARGVPSSLATTAGDRLAENRASTYAPDQQAEELYLDGMEKLDAGHTDWARQTFEGLIAQFPSSAAAEHARTRLGELDRGARVLPGGVHAGAALPVPPPIQRVVAPVVSGAAWEQELQRNGTIQSKLRREAGDRVFFGPGSAELGTRARSALASQAQWLKQWREFEAAIEGHADESGSDSENLQLSTQRAEAVRQGLVAEGIDPSRLAIVAWGRAHRLALCSDIDCPSQNRRAVTLVFARGAQARLGLNLPDKGQLPPPGATSLAPIPGSTAPAISEPIGVTR
jgi:outer membrane protein OmpA-like peptidoglycan-associated protein